jgi:hypothetical protein
MAYKLKRKKPVQLLDGTYAEEGQLIQGSLIPKGFSDLFEKIVEKKEEKKEEKIIGQNPNSNEGIIPKPKPTVISVKKKEEETKEVEIQEKDEEQDIVGSKDKKEYEVRHVGSGWYQVFEKGIDVPVIDKKYREAMAEKKMNEL